MKWYFGVRRSCLAVVIAAFVLSAVHAQDNKLIEVGQLMADIMIPLRPEMEQTMITAAANHFTLEEIQALSSFYKSAEGASVMAKMQPFMQETMSGIMPRMMQASQELGPDINRILEIQQ